MELDKIMEKLQQDHVWAADIPGLEPCVFCGGEGRVVVRNPLWARSGAWVRCRRCGADGPCASILATVLTTGKFSTPLLPESLERGITAAIDAWNSRSVDRSRMGNLRLDGRTTA